MPGFVSVPVETEDDMTEDQVNALIDARILRANRTKTQRRWSGISVPTGGTRNGTASAAAPGITCSSGSVGANKVTFATEIHGQDGNMFAGPDIANFWERSHYIHCLISPAASGNTITGTPSTTTYAGIQLSGENVSAPFATPPTQLTSSDAILWVRNVLSSGDWELVQSCPNNNIQRVDTLTGVDPLNLNGGEAYTRVELYYSPTSISVAINGVTGINLTGSDIVIDTVANTMGHLGAGVFVTSGSNSDCAVTMTFLNFIAETTIAE